MVDACSESGMKVRHCAAAVSLPLFSRNWTKLTLISVQSVRNLQRQDLCLKLLRCFVNKVGGIYIYIQIRPCRRRKIYFHQEKDYQRETALNEGMKKNLHNHHRGKEENGEIMESRKNAFQFECIVSMHQIIHQQPIGVVTQCNKLSHSWKWKTLNADIGYSTSFKAKRRKPGNK